MQAPKTHSFDKACREAFSLAAAAFLKKDIQACCDNAGARLLRSQGQQARIEMLYCHATAGFSIPDFIFSTTGGTVSIREKILMLHYLCTADGFPVRNWQINFKQLKTAATYFPLFEKRCIQPFVRQYLREPRRLIAQMKKLGGRQTPLGDFSLSLSVFPRVPVVFLVWQADDEFQAQGNILFDESIEHYLSGEDIVVMCQQVIMKAAS